MALAFGSYQRLERMLLKTRNIIGEDNPTFREDNKTQALQFAASFYGLYGGDGSEATFTDLSSLTVMQSELIASAAAKELTLSAISYYKDDVVSANGGPASATFRSDKLTWLRAFIEELNKKIDDLEKATGFGASDGVLPGLFLDKIRVHCDPPADVCSAHCDSDLDESFTVIQGLKL